MTLPATRAGDAHRVESLAVDETVDVDLAGRYSARRARIGARTWMAFSPSTRGRCARGPVGADDGAERAVASALDLPVGRLAENREVAANRSGRVRASA
jgi:hypothetical protein